MINIINSNPQVIPNNKSKLLHQVRVAIQARHYSHCPLVSLFVGRQLSLNISIGG